MNRLIIIVFANLALLPFLAQALLNLVPPGQLTLYRLAALVVLAAFNALLLLQAAACP